RIPKEWEVNRLGKICELLNGLAFKPSDWSSTGIPIIRIQNLNQGTEFNYFDGVIPDKYIIPPGTLLFSWSGNRGTSFGPFIWSGPTGVLNQHIFKVIPREGIRLHWFCYSLDDVRQRVEKAAHGGSGLVHIKRSDLTSYLVATPDEKEQKQIEETISSHDARIRTEEQYRDKLKLQKKGLMHDLLTGKIRVKV
ncbi:MAG: restriction endonuclease subunit S, partial [Nitrospiraceae bacterium]|nr:restriction endonuclease subunit S [Nitrospiraceae bacterium]